MELVLDLIEPNIHGPMDSREGLRVLALADAGKVRAFPHSASQQQRWARLSRMPVCLEYECYICRGLRIRLTADIELIQV